MSVKGRIKRITLLWPIEPTGMYQQTTQFADVLSNATNSGNWDHLLARIQQSSMYRRSCYLYQFPTLPIKKVPVGKRTRVSLSEQAAPDCFSAKNKTHPEPFHAALAYDATTPLIKRNLLQSSHHSTTSTVQRITLPFQYEAPSLCCRRCGSSLCCSHHLCRYRCS